MTSQAQLTSQSTLAELCLQEYQVSPEISGNEIMAQMEQEPNLSGVLVLGSNGALLGMISRQQLYHELSQPFALELLLKRPIQVFLDFNPRCRNPLILSYADRIDQAVIRCLERSSQDMSEPVVVEFRHRQLPDLHSYFLLNAQTLFLAHSEILKAVNQQMQKQTQLLAQERNKVKAYLERLELQKTEITEHNLLLEQQQQQLQRQAEEIQILNQRFVYIGKVLSREGKKAFQATFAGVNAICQNIDQITSIGKLLESELETIDSASALIEKVSRQVRQLSIQAAIAINKQKVAEVSGFSYIIKEIGYLINQTGEGGRQMRLLADRFRERVDMFTNSAQSGTSVARSLILEIEQAAIALAALERLLRDNQSSFSDINEENQTIKRQEMVLLRQKLAKAEGALATLRQTVANDYR